MNRRQLVFVILMNALISLVIAVLVVWVVEARRPDPEKLAALAPVAAAGPPATYTATPAAPGTPTGQAPAAATPAATAAPAAPAGTPDGGVYVVQAGDSLSGIADRFGVALTELIAANKLSNPDFVFSGQRLVIPAAGGKASAAAATPAPAVNQGIRVSAVVGGGDLAKEAVAVVNDSDLAINLQGWRLEKQGGPAYTFGDLVLFPGSGIQVFTGGGTNSSVAVYWNQPAPLWQAGSVARLLNAQGTQVAQMTAP